MDVSINEILPGVSALIAFFRPVFLIFSTVAVVGIVVRWFWGLLFGK